MPTCQDVSFQLRAGEVLGVAGLVGSRRTELLSTIFGIMSRESGEITLKGKPISNKTPRQSIKNGFAMLTEAFQRAKSTDPVKVAAVMEGMKFKSFNGEVEMRKKDHQLQQGLYISRWEKTDAQNPIDQENTGYTFKQVKYFEPYVASTPTSCEMKRPS